MFHQNRTPTNVIILHKNPRPQRLFMASLAGSPPKIAGRIGGHYLSEDMVKIKEWCEENTLEWSFNYFDEAGVPFLEENMLGVIGELTQEMMNTFPMKYNNVEVLK